MSVKNVKGSEPSLKNRISMNNLFQFIIALVAVLILPQIFNGAYLIHVMQTIAIYYIVVMGLNILIGYVGELSLGHAGFYAIGAYFSGLLVMKAGFSFWITLFIAAIAAAVVGAVIALLSLRVKGPYLAMLTIAFGMATFYIANQWIGLTGGPMGLYGVPRPTIFGNSLNNIQYFYLISITAVILQILANNLLDYKWGRVFHALSGSEVAAKTLGINIYASKVVAFSISAFCAGIAGAFFAHQSGFLNSDTFVYDTSIMFLIGVILGGSGTKLGPLVGSVIIILLKQITASVVDYHLLILGGLLLIFVIFIPDGIVGTISNIIRNRKLKDSNKVANIVTYNCEDVNLEWFDFPKINSDEFLKIDGATKIFGVSTNNQKNKNVGLKAVDSVDLVVKQGTIHGLIGPNGSGKTTLVNMISGIYSLNSGNLTWLGENVNKCVPHQMARKRITRTFQNLQIFSNLSVIDNVMIGFHIHFKSNFIQCLFKTKIAMDEEREFRQKAYKLLKFMGIAEFSDNMAGSLSYGDQRRLEIARSLALQPSLLLLDEPAAGLNTAEAEQLSKLILKIRDAGVTVLVIEHHIELVMKICDTVSVFDYGKKIADGDPHTVKKDKKVIEAYIGTGRRASHAKS